MKKILLAVTGASGSLYALQFADLLRPLDVEVHGIISAAGEKVLHWETGLSFKELAGITSWFPVGDFSAPPASGTAGFDAMAVLPCSMGTLGAIANGLSMNLIHRAADVMLKERRPLLLAVRETPFNRTHLRNMSQAAEAGAIICPAMPAFYHKPLDLNEMARHYAARVAEQLGIEVPGMKRWSGCSC